MKNVQKIGMAVLTLSLIVAPAYAAMEGSAGPGGELTLADFQRMNSGNKPIVAVNKYREYKYRLKHAAPQPTLDVSRMRTEERELTLADFKRRNPKPWIAAQEFERYQDQKNRPAEPYVAPAFTSTGKPAADWLKARQLQKG